MKQYDIEHLRTIAVIGHPGSGKTSFMESMLYVTGAKIKKGKVDDKNTTSDYLVEEKHYLSSISTSLIPIEYEGYKFNFLDTPGNRELVSEVSQALSVVKGAILMIDGSKGIDIGTEQVLADLSELNIPTIIFINKMDKENVKFEELIDNLHKIIGNKAVPFLWPIVEGQDFKGYIDLVDMKARVLEGQKIVEKPMPDYLTDKVEELREKIFESVAETSEELLEKYFGGEELTYKEICEGLRYGVLAGDLKPIVFGSLKKDIGVLDILEMIAKFMPAPNDLKPKIGKDPKTGETFERKTTDDEPFSGYVFKTTIDPFVGTMNMVKVYSGTLQSGQKITVTNTNKTIKTGSITLLRGKEQLDTDMIHAGDVGVITKIDEIFTGCTIADPKNPIIYEGPGFPSPTIYIAVKPKNKKDEDKISSALRKLLRSY